MKLAPLPNHCGLPKSRALLATVLALLSGCASHTAGTPPQKTRTYAYAQGDLDELLTFGSDLAGMNEAELANICREMRRRENLPALAGGTLVLHQMLGQLRYDQCADYDSLVARMNSFLLESLPDHRSRQLVLMQAAILRRQRPPSVAPVKSAPAGARNRPRKAAPRPKPAPPASAPGSQPVAAGDASLLRQKLEAIRAMERRMDTAGEGR